MADDSQLLEPLLGTGQKLFVVAGPETASGYDWYFVLPLGDLAITGWVAAAARDGTPWLEPAVEPCLQNPSLQDLSTMDRVQQVACYGQRGLASNGTSRDFTFTDRLYWGPMCGDGGDLGGPAWMVSCSSTFYWGINDRGVILAIPPHLAEAAGSLEPYGSFLATVTAHLDDPAATECTYGGYEVPEDPELAEAGAVFFCRSIFVASSLVRH